jgi:hypothetical protein
MHMSQKVVKHVNFGRNGVTFADNELSDLGCDSGIAACEKVWRHVEKGEGEGDPVRTRQRISKEFEHVEGFRKCRSDGCSIGATSAVSNMLTNPPKNHRADELPLMIARSKSVEPVEYDGSISPRERRVVKDEDDESARPTIQRQIFKKDESLTKQRQHKRSEHLQRTEDLEQLLFISDDEHDESACPTIQRQLFKKDESLTKRRQHKRSEHLQRTEDLEQLLFISENEDDSFLQIDKKQYTGLPLFPSLQPQKILRSKSVAVQSPPESPSDDEGVREHMSGFRRTKSVDFVVQNASESHYDRVSEDGRYVRRPHPLRRTSLPPQIATRGVNFVHDVVQNEPESASDEKVRRHAHGARNTHLPSIPGLPSRRPHLLRRTESMDHAVQNQHEAPSGKVSKLHDERNSLIVIPHTRILGRIRISRSMSPKAREAKIRFQSGITEVVYQPLVENTKTT